MSAPKIKSRTENSARNTAVALVGRILAILLGYAVRVVFTRTLAQVYVGVNGLFLDIIYVLSLSELGIETAVTYALYKPIAEGDVERQKSIMRYYAKLYRMVAVAVAVLGFAVLPFLPSLIADYDALDHVTFIYLLYLSNAVASYLLIYKRTLIDAHQMSYITSLYHNGFLMLQYVIQMIVLVVTREFVPYLVVAIACTVGGNLALSRKADKMYPYLRDRDVQDFDHSSIERDVRAMLLHKVGLVVVNNTDNLVLSSLFGLVMVGIYSNYFLIIGSVKQVCHEFFLGMAASVGNLGVTSTKKRVQRILEAALLAAALLYGWAGICLYELIDPFVALSFGENYLFGRGVVLVLCVNFVVMGLRSPSMIFHDSLGLFHYDRFKTIGEAAINLIASVILAHLIGPVGVFCGTLFATLATSSWIEPWVIYRKSLGRSPARYYARLCAYVAIIAFAWALTTWTCGQIRGDPLPVMLMRIPICMVVPIAVFCVVFWRTPEFRLLVQKAMQLLRHRFDRRGREEK